MGTFNRKCKYAQNKVEAFVHKLNDTINSYTHKANKWDSDAKQATTDAKSNTQNLKDTQTRLQGVLKNMAQTVVTYQGYEDESEAKLLVVKQLRDIIEDELMDETSKPSSLIQLNKFNENLGKLQALIAKSGDALYTPIIQTLVELATEGHFSDQAVLRKILTTLAQLKASVEKFRDEKHKQLNETMVLYKSQEENLESQIVQYSKLGERYLSVVAEAHQNMDVLSKDVANLRDEIRRKESESMQISHLCDLENKVFKNGKSRVALVIKDLQDALGQVQTLSK